MEVIKNTTEDGRRIFSIDVGDLSPEEALKVIDKIKTEMSSKTDAEEDNV